MLATSIQPASYRNLLKANCSSVNTHTTYQVRSLDNSITEISLIISTKEGGIVYDSKLEKEKVSPGCKVDNIVEVRWLRFTPSIFCIVDGLNLLMSSSYTHYTKEEEETGVDFTEASLQVTDLGNAVICSGPIHN